MKSNKEADLFHLWINRTEIRSKIGSLFANSGCKNCTWNVLGVKHLPAIDENIAELIFRRPKLQERIKRMNEMKCTFFDQSNANWK